MSTSLVGSGIAHTAQDGTGTKVLLPLEEVRVTASIVDVSAKVLIRQRYCNPSDVATSRCKYLFPVPANAAICSFQMQTEHGRVVVGVCKEKHQAQEEFEAALAAGNSVGLTEYVNDDTFVISIGSIPARTNAEVNLTYVVSLMNDDAPNGIRFQLPMAVGHRYGVTPAPLKDAVQPQSGDQTRVEISIDIQTHGAIEGVECISHRQETRETKYTTHDGRVSRRRTNVTYRSDSFLDRDFLLIIHAEGLDEPRCFAELYTNPEQGKANTLALQLAIIPRLTLPSIPSQEYIFLIDRSGSMEGASITVAKETLMLLLRLIPSQLYNQTNLEAATAYVDGMNANMGGTEIRRALLDVFAKWSRTLAVAVFVLTDGGAYDVEGTADAVRSAVQFKPGPPARVYTLGIGDGVSTAMCESIARAGNGICLFALSAESIVGRCARLFHAGSKQTVKNVAIDWNVPNAMVSETESASVSFVEGDRSHTSRISWRTPSIQQAPSRISALHADIKMNVYAILSMRQGLIPGSVTLQGQIEDTKDLFEITVPVRGVQVNDEPTIPMIHTLAAWHIIQEHQAKVGPLPRTVTAPGTEGDLRKAVIISLGEDYQVISAHTSFVAVDRGRDYEDSISDISIDDNDVDDSLGAVQHRQDYPDDSASESEPSLDSQHSEDEATRRGARAQARHTGRGKTTFAKVVGSVFSWVTSAFAFRPAASNLRRRGNGGMDGEIEPDLRIPGGWYDFTDEGSVGGNYADSDKTFTTLSSLEGSCSSCNGSRSTLLLPQRPIITEDDRRAYRSPSPPLFSNMSLAGTSATNHQTSSSPSGQQGNPVRPEVVRIVRLQQDDGSFTMSDSLKRIVGNVAFTNAIPPGVHERVWATALAVAFLMKNMRSQKELLVDILAKPLDFLSRQAGSDEVIRHTKRLLQV